jgi:hypothetical protein
MISLHIVKSHEGWLEWCDLRTSAAKLMLAMLRGFLKSPDEAPTRP